MAERAHRNPTVPPDIGAAFTVAGVMEIFETMAPSHRREWIMWIEDAKKDATRRSRIENPIARIGPSEG